MILNLGSLAFNANIESGGGTPAWGTELGQGEGYKFVFEDMSDFFTGMVYKSVSDTENVTCPLGKGGNQRDDYDFVIASVFDKVYVNGKRVNDARFLLLVVKKLNGDHHVGRRTIKYNPRMTYHREYLNEDCYRKMVSTMGLPEDAAWFVYEIFIKNQDELHFTAFELGQEPQSYRSNDERRNAFISRLPKGDKHSYLNASPSNRILQQIYYGAPGTGKSHEVKKMTNKDNSIRTTFHPDSDYSTFVGAYKPIVDERPRYGLNQKETVRMMDEDKQPLNEKTITYSFVPQAFIKAYAEAWSRYAKWQQGNGEGQPQPYYLVIEEINRGNCAQIFGDLFQLLDRCGNGLSGYAISPDNDIQRYLSETEFDPSKAQWGLQNLELTGMFMDDEGEVLSTADEIKSGRLMLLPPNLYIWATMNTSDQSLFPIDSAFKRRWEWKYMKIKNEGKEWKIDVMTKDANGEEKLVDWWDFIYKVNEIIASMTSSADKQLGYFFCKADKKTPERAEQPNSENNLISVDTFVSKVLFYLWNDVFKDYGFEDASLFQYIAKTKDGNETKKDLTFPNFYEEDSNEVNPKMVTDFVQKVMNWKKKEEEKG